MSLTKKSAATFVLIIALLPISMVKSAEYASHGIFVVDGDTIKYQGQRMRLLDIDAPETFKPRCADEAKKGHEATFQVRTWLQKSRGFKIEYSGKHDRYGRPLIHLKLDGKDVGESLKQKGLAVVWQPGRVAWLQRAKHWCPNYQESKYDYLR